VWLRQTALSCYDGHLSGRTLCDVVPSTAVRAVGANHCCLFNSGACFVPIATWERSWRLFALRQCFVASRCSAPPPSRTCGSCRATDDVIRVHLAARPSDLQRVCCATLSFLNICFDLLAGRHQVVILTSLAQSRFTEGRIRQHWILGSTSLYTGWTVRGLNIGGGEIFRTRPDRPWGPPSLLYNEYRVFFPRG
jgi:hypothetical protein